MQAVPQDRQGDEVKGANGNMRRTSRYLFHIQKLPSCCHNTADKSCTRQSQPCTVIHLRASAVLLHWYVGGFLRSNSIVSPYAVLILLLLAGDFQTCVLMKPFWRLSGVIIHDWNGSQWFAPIWLVRIWFS